MAARLSSWVKPLAQEPVLKRRGAAGAIKRKDVRREACFCVRIDAWEGLGQYCSLNNFNALIEIDSSGWMPCSGAEAVVAHLALDPSEIDSIPARTHALIKNFVENRLMERFPVLRGE
jgi:hypothetical protein